MLPALQRGIETTHCFNEAAGADPADARMSVIIDG